MNKLMSRKLFQVIFFLQKSQKMWLCSHATFRVIFHRHQRALATVIVEKLFWRILQGEIERILVILCRNMQPEKSLDVLPFLLKYLSGHLLLNIISTKILA